MYSVVRDFISLVQDDVHYYSVRDVPKGVSCLRHKHTTTCASGCYDEVRSLSSSSLIKRDASIFPRTLSVVYGFVCFGEPLTVEPRR